MTYIKKIRVAYNDMYEGYINAIKEVLGKEVEVVVDRFYVAKRYRKGLDELRKKEGSVALAEGAIVSVNDAPQ